jgi:hypothetical protein
MAGLANRKSSANIEEVLGETGCLVLPSDAFVLSKRRGSRRLSEARCPRPFHGK